MKACSCGRVYSPAEWLKLPLVGIQTFEGDDAPPALELRNCICKSTMAVEVPSKPREVKP